MDKNRTALVGIIAALVGLIFIGIMVLIALGRDVEQVTTFALIVIPIVIAAAGLGINQISQSEKLDTIGKNVNGNSTRLIDAVAELQGRLGGEPVLDDAELDRLRADKDRLPSHRA